LRYAGYITSNWTLNRSDR